MAKRRKRTNKDVPAKGRVREMADDLWSLAVKDDWANKCAMCGHCGDLNSHHLLPRQHTNTRHELKNGICLCRRCHQFCPDRSPHQNAGGFVVWLAGHHPIRHKWYMSQNESCKYKDFHGTTNAWYYIDIIGTLREYVSDDDYVRIVGKKFAKYMEERGDD